MKLILTVAVAGLGLGAASFAYLHTARQSAETLSCCDDGACSTTETATATPSATPASVLFLDVAASAPASAPAATTAAKVVDFGNTKCPVMDGDVDKDVTLTYKGVLYHFCCKDCFDDFNKTPDKYIKVMTDNPEKYGLTKK